MKLTHRYIEKHGAGEVTMIPVESEDMWHAYNLIAVGDSIRSTTIRKVQQESATGSSTASRVRTVLTITVEGIEFDHQVCMLRVKGRNIVENQYVKLGAYHTIDLELNRKVTLKKHYWDIVSLDRLDLACDATQSADVAAIVMQEGLAHICLVLSSMTLLRAKVEQSIPRKRKGNCSQHDKAMQKFFDSVMQGVVRHVNFDVVKCVLICSPGFVKDQYCEYMFTEALKTDVKVITENKAKFIQVHSSSGYKHALTEVLSDPAVMAKLSDTKAAEEVKALESFYQMLQNESGRAFYGLRHVEKANEANAIETLLISDELFRSCDFHKRKQYVRLVESVKDSGGDVKVFSSLHVSGEQLGQLTGLAALLRFPLPELSDEEMSDSD